MMPNAWFNVIDVGFGFALAARWGTRPVSWPGTIARGVVGAGLFYLVGVYEHRVWPRVVVEPRGRPRQAVGTLVAR